RGHGRRTRRVEASQHVAQTAEAAQQVEPVQGGEDIEKRAAGTGREEQALGGELAPRHYLTGDEYETQAERDPDQVTGAAPTTGGAAGVGGAGGCAGGEAAVVTGAPVTARSPVRPRPALHNPSRGRRSRCRTRWDPAPPPAVVHRNCRRGVARWSTTRARSPP